MTLIPGDVPEEDQEWDMVRRLEKQRKDTSDEAVIRRLMWNDKFQEELEKSGFRPLIEDSVPDPARPHNREPMQVRGMPEWFIGLGVVPIDPFIRAHLEIPEDAGLQVTSVLKDSPAAEAGIAVNDILLSANGQKVISLGSLQRAVLNAGRNDRALELQMIRKGKATKISMKPRGPESKPKPATEADKPDHHPMERRLDEMQRRLNKQQREIEVLRRQISGLKSGKMKKRKKQARESATPPRESR